MVKSMKDKVSDFIVEIILACVLSVAAILWSFNVAIAANTLGVENNKDDIKETQALIERLRKENRDDHEKIIQMLRK